MPKQNTRSAIVDELESQIMCKFNEIQFNLARNSLKPVEIQRERRLYYRLLWLHEYLSRKRYFHPRDYSTVDRSTLNFMLNEISDRNFKQQFRMERVSYELIVSKIRDDEVRLAFINRYLNH